ncbi:hypothetical protein GTQ43_20790 [Nostoc sp. KVJ3]|uniref:hypothetical protein n=1 Tax=Nostoc sp. KVJ3 TaxID=457945 RepID=UPI0022382465|nr:hypothetical protein [Nostoc sp. KVJ3]MCW5316162.1 hypothetical protein [Nostoc sp. KVJ3]
MKRKDLEQLANYLGYDFRELVDDWRYKDRKGKVYEIIDRREKKVAAVFSTLSQIEAFLKQYTL